MHCKCLLMTQSGHSPLGREVGELPVLGLILPFTHDEQIGIPIWSSGPGKKTPKNLQRVQKAEKRKLTLNRSTALAIAWPGPGSEFSLTAVFGKSYRIQLVPS